MNSSLVSVGQLVIDALAARLGISMRADRGGVLGRGNVRIGNSVVDVTLFKSSMSSVPRSIVASQQAHHNPIFTESLMNISGPSIVKAYRQAVNSPTSMIVLTDSLSHRPGTLSVKLGGSAEGHNGVKSIIQALGGEPGFYRFRLGIGRDGTDAADYVLQRLSSFERQFWNNEGLDLVLREIEKIALKTG